MREGWEYKKLGECTQILDSQRKPVTKKDRKEGVYPYYGATGIQDYVDKYIFDGRYVLVGEDGAKWGAFDKSAFIIDGKTWVNNHAHVLKPFEPLVDSYLTYYLNHSDLNGFISGAIVRKLTQSSLKNIKIPLPPKSTQLAIVSELDKINELIRLKKEQLKDFDNLAQSLFYEMFGDPVENEKGWEVKKLVEVSSLINGRAYKQNELLNEGKYKVLRVGNFFTNSNYYYSNLELDDEKYCYKGDLLFAWSASFGAFIWDEGKTIFHYHIWRVLFDEKNLNIYYYKYLLNTMTNFFMNDVHGIGMVHLTKAGMEQYNLPLPPLPLQHLFAQRIEQIEHQKAEVQKAITDLETLLASRMQYWFE